MVLVVLFLMMAYMYSVNMVVFSLVTQIEVSFLNFLFAFGGTYLVVKMILEKRVEIFHDPHIREEKREKYALYTRIVGIAFLVLLPFAFSVSEWGGGYENWAIEWEREEKEDSDARREVTSTTAVDFDNNTSSPKSWNSCEMEGCNNTKRSGADYCSLHYEGTEERLQYRQETAGYYNWNTEEIDPDDYDLDGYYEDYQKDFYNMDEAYDAFQDDEDAWEDY
ncbi:MAG: hypothetical protein IJ040_05110 [Lachnospiraceae bacterium]|nr:hypothetical protein [Lachnospiraceae bacterium]